MEIYMIPMEILADEFDELNGFLPSDWNELRELPEKVLLLLQFCKDADLVYNPYNFMLDFNLNQEGTNSEDYLMFIPHEKFNIN